ncbi:MAG: flavodoxin [Methanomicrobiales archaeon]|jgi:flavodoxin|nr:flavodoxin [Methanomicrobiales archaeon]
MKRVSILILAVLLLLLCTTPTFAAETTSDALNNEDQDEQSSTSLIVYFSHTGNTLELAKHIQELTDAEMFEIEPVIPYPEVYEECVRQARTELADGVFPEISDHVDDIASYDLIYLGYPIWIGTIPRPVATFLVEHELEGKTIIPFCTYGGGGISHSVTDIQALVPEATVREAFGVTGTKASEAKDAVYEWLKELDIDK